MTTLERLQAAYARVEEALRLLDNTDYGFIAERADEVLVELESAVEGERVRSEVQQAPGSHVAPQVRAQLR